MSEAVEDQIRQAEQALEDAVGANDADLSDAVIVNRLYYACIHAAQAVLYNQGHEPTSHGGVLSLFGSEVVVGGDATREQGRLLNDLSTLRKRADYGHEPVDVDIESLLDKVDSFVLEMKQLVNS
jgi:uncharacterized protein (UPF0332 family)